jgi:hypothetical protein
MVREVIGSYSLFQEGYRFLWPVPIAEPPRSGVWRPLILHLKSNVYPNLLGGAYEAIGPAVFGHLRCVAVRA